MSHDALSRTGGGHKTDPNAWFVGMVPRRNPDIVVAVLWEHGNWGNNSAKLAAQVINAFVTKQRKHENNIRIAETPVATTTASTSAPSATVDKTTPATP
jgi:penicillin-binding protein 2